MHGMAGEMVPSTVALKISVANPTRPSNTTIANLSVLVSVRFVVSVVKDVSRDREYD